MMRRRWIPVVFMIALSVLGVAATTAGTAALEHVHALSVAAHPSDGRTLYVGTHEAGVLKTTGGGEAWVAVNVGLASLNVHALAVDPHAPDKPHAAVRERGAGLYRTTDGGRQWRRVDDGPPGETKVLAAVNIPTGVGGIFLYAGTAGGLMRDPDCFCGWKPVGGQPTSSVDGLAWAPAANGPKNAAAVAVNPRRPSDVYAAITDGRVFPSRDGGVTWDARH